MSHALLPVLHLCAVLCAVHAPLLQIELWYLYNFMAAAQPIAGQGGAAASCAHECVTVAPLLYRPHGPINATSGSSSSIGASVMGEGGPVPLWEYDAWGYPYPANR